MQEETESNISILMNCEGRMLCTPFFGLRDMNRLEEYIKKAVSGLLLVILVSFNISPVMSFAANDKVELSVVTDKSEYASGDVVSTEVKITNYNDTFSGTITTMVIELTYDESILEVDISSMKKIADDNGGMGFDHIAAKDGKVTYQYLNVSEPLKKGSEDIFSLKFNVKGDISSQDNLKNALKISNAVIQNGTKATSEKYEVNISYTVNENVNKVADDNSIGEKVYNESGDLLADDEQQQIKENASVNSATQNDIDNSSDKDTSDKTEETSVDVKTDYDTSDDNISASPDKEKVSTSGNDNSTVSSETMNKEPKKANTKMIASIVVIAALMAGGAVYIVIKHRKTENKDEEN